MSSTLIVFLILAVVAIGAAIGMLTSRNSVYSALFLVLNFLAVAMIYLELGAPFIALSQITVYAGSIMVLFLFVIMMLGAERLPERETLSWQRGLGAPLALLLLGVFLYNLFRANGMDAVIGPPPADYGTPHEIGVTLFNQFSLPFEITGVILLTAVVGAILLAKVDPIRARKGAGAHGTAPGGEEGRKE